VEEEGDWKTRQRVEKEESSKLRPALLSPCLNVFGDGDAVYVKVLLIKFSYLLDKKKTKQNKTKTNKKPKTKTPKKKNNYK
jgi:hypothetical protein